MGELIKDARSHFAKLFGVGKNYVEQAHTLLKDDPPAAVKDGAPLKEKYEEVMTALIWGRWIEAGHGLTRRNGRA